MAIVNNATNFNGDLNDYLYKVMGIGNDVAEKGAIHFIPDVGAKLQLDRLITTEDPFQDFTTAAPTFANVTTKYKNELDPQKFTISGKIDPTAWMSVWRKYRSQGTLTQLQANSQFLADVFALVKNSAQRQLAKLIWQGDTTAGGASPLRFFDGLIKLITANGNKIVVPAAGVITQANVIDILESVYDAIPNKYLDNPDFRILMSTSDFKLLQKANLDAKKTTTGVLDQGIQKLFLEQRIEHFNSLPKDNILGAVAKSSMDSNFVLGMYFDLDSEFSTMEVGKIVNFGKEYGYRVDAMAAVNFRYGGDIVFYKPA